MADVAALTAIGDSSAGVFITGSASGHLHWWRGRRAERTTKAHAVSWLFESVTCVHLANGLKTVF
jgi:hypothetical protein